MSHLQVSAWTINCLPFKIQNYVAKTRIGYFARLTKVCVECKITKNTLRFNITYWELKLSSIERKNEMFSADRCITLMLFFIANKVGPINVKTQTYEFSMQRLLRTGITHFVSKSS